jgi:hypothetical protein
MHGKPTVMDREGLDVSPAGDPYPAAARAASASARFFSTMRTEMMDAS